MRLVNERLDDKEAALTDGTMGTVASLSSYEVKASASINDSIDETMLTSPQATNGSISAVQTHLQGLKKMVTLRGGIHESGMNAYTARLVLW